MGARTGFGLKFVQWFVRGIQFCCAAIVLAIYSYFLATLHNHHLPIATSLRAVEGISGAAVAYALLALLTLCCLAGRTLTALFGVVLDICFIGAFVYVAVANKNGAGTCDGVLDTPFGKGQSDATVKAHSGFTTLPSFHTACRLQTACLAVSIIAIFFYILSILMEVALARHHRKEKRYGPSPRNDYTSGFGRTASTSTRKPGFFGRFLGGRKVVDASEEGNMLPAHPQPDQLNAHHHHADNNDISNPYVHTDYNNKYETGYGYSGVTGPAATTNTTAYAGAGGYAAPQGTAGYGQPVNYRYDDGIYDHAQR
ncbi:hypothetical protein BBK36DRAFT_1128091 [Trichoderma citrinoviride]|uniref:MARVEL domain-containing protein n=1 Tax=Trichoderma citrinoviride TaxID=58853 RepID=A0A2T4B0N5_9HYPO|nr:hypothetical protein BBK36DRAFT_1128091 [Trichoderma citrinoviride]PTB62884.1 hypothetical protein BBK36DRAFT_1128091 [Trichoderma citrinoviride]